jgi:HlyD family secretion protein
MTAPRLVAPISLRFRHRLPDISSPTSAGVTFVRRAVTATLSVVGLLVMVLFAVAVTVPFDAVIDATGVLEPESRVVVRARETGVVRAVLVRAGDTVRAGQVVAFIDTVAFVAQRQQLNTALSVAWDGLNRTIAGREVRRDRDGSVTRTWQIGSQVALDDAMSQVQRAADMLAQRRLLDERIRRSAVRSPTSGVVLTDQPERFVGVVLREGEPLLEVAELRQWQLEVYVREPEAYRIVTGASVRAELSAPQLDAPVDLLWARVAAVGLAPEFGPEARSTAPTAPGRAYRVLVRLDSAALAPVRRDRLKRGYTARVKIITDRATMLQRLWRSLRHHSAIA